MIKKILALLISTVLSNQVLANSEPKPTTKHSVEKFCKDLSKKLRTVEKQVCNDFKLDTMNHFSDQGYPLTHKEILPKKGFSPKGKILFIGGVHGDEYAAISLTYLWLKTLLSKDNQTPYHWLFLPLANPDGLFQSPATRANGNSVDLNRNFPSPDWDEKAISTWKIHYNSDKRRYPGKSANSEIETQWMVKIIQRFNPDAIIAVHAPYGLLDYDGPSHAQPNNIGHLEHRALGTYPGSLGRYAGEHLKIPVMTLELGSAGKMPTPKEIQIMLEDLEQWVDDKIKQKFVDM